MSELPLSLSIVTGEKMTVKMLERGTPLPATKTRIFTTKEPIPGAVMIELVTGERLVAGANRRVTRIRLGGIKKTFGGVARIAVKIDVSEQSEISIEAFDYGSHHKKNKTIGSDWLPDEKEIEAALEDAAKSEDEEKIIREHARLIDQAKASTLTVRSIGRSEKSKLESAQWTELKNCTKDLRKRTRRAKANKLTQDEADTISKEMDHINSLIEEIQQ